MTTKIFAHRGWKAMYPENTLLSFQKALEIGVDGLELDVHMTKDGKLVVIHDEQLERTTNGSGYIHEHTLMQLNEYSAGVMFQNHPNFIVDWALEKIPTLEEVLLLQKKFPQVELNLELKTNIFNYPGIEEKVYDLVQQFGSEQSVIYSSFHLPTLIRLRSVSTAARIAWLIERDISQPLDYLKTFGFESLHVDGRLLIQNQIKWLKIAPEIRVWTVNEEKQLKELLEMGIEAIITDNPDLAMTLRDATSSVI